MEIRQQKGKQIAQRAAIKRDGQLWLVPSQNGHGRYKVDAERQRCSCPDFEFRQAACKHIYAVQFTLEEIERTKTTVTENGKTTVTETVKIKRQTYRQAWPAYNKAQTTEKAQFLYLLHKLCEGVGEPAQATGRPRLPLEDMLFSMAFKVYSTMSGRRFVTDLKAAHARGYVAQPPSYNTIFRYFESEVLTPYLKMLIEESALPLQAIEQDFAVDSSGLATGARLKWHDTKWGRVHVEHGDTSRRVERKDWIKLHITCGVTTNIVTAVEITDSHAGDSPQFAPLVEATAQNFTMRQVSADKAYLSNANLKAVVDAQAMPYIPFKSSSTGTDRKNSSLFKQMFHFYSYNQERFMQNYHKRSNVETTFHMIKSKFGDALRSKTKTAQINEALCKVLCHNIVVLIQSMYELNLKPKFWKEVAA